MNSSESGNLMYNKSSFINNDEIGVVCVMRTVKDVKVNENV